jgi:hypothetical protein
VKDNSPAASKDALLRPHEMGRVVMLRFVAPAIWLAAGACLVIMAASNGVIPFVLVASGISLAWALLQIAKPPSAPRLGKPES